MLMISVGDIPRSQEHSHAHRLLRECLKKLGIDYSEELVSLGGHGKPYLRDFPCIHYNLTHSRGIAACIVSGSECGIDGEKIRPYRPNVVKREFSERERQLIENAPEKERDELFFRIWTLKESYIKATGQGLSFPLKNAEFLFEDGRIVTNISGCSFRQYIIRSEYIISIACLDFPGKL